MRPGEGRVRAGKAQLNAIVYRITWPWRLGAHVIMHTQIGGCMQLALIRIESRAVEGTTKAEALKPHALHRRPVLYRMNCMRVRAIRIFS